MLLDFFLFHLAGCNRYYRSMFCDKRGSLIQGGFVSRISIKTVGWKKKSAVIYRKAFDPRGLRHGVKEDLFVGGGVWVFRRLCMLIAPQAV